MKMQKRLTNKYLGSQIGNKYLLHIILYKESLFFPYSTYPHEALGIL
jgi:hypothetical protein